MKKFKKFIKNENLVGYGTSRIVFDLEDGNVIKIPYNNLGIYANKIENDYYNQNPGIIAKIVTYKNHIIIQEKLTDTITVPMKYTKENKVKEYLETKFQGKDLKLIDKMLYARAQVGLNHHGELRFFDYEDSKIKAKLILEPFILNEDWIDMCIQYLQNTDLENIQEWETFEDHRGFLSDK